jgi:hypothetical protein
MIYPAELLSQPNAITLTGLPYTFISSCQVEERKKLLPHIKREGSLTYYKTNLLFKPDEKKAILVPFERLNHLKKLFPAMIVENFEFSDDFYFPPAEGRSTTRCNYYYIVDMCDDKQLWNDDHIAHSSVELPLIKEQFKIDVIIHVPMHDGNHAQREVLRTLAAKRWTSSPKFNHTYVRSEENQVNNPHFVIAAMDTSELETYWLPMKGGGMSNKKPSSG